MYTSSTGVKKQFISEFRRRYWIAWDVVKQKFKNRACDYGGKCTEDHFRINGIERHMDLIWEKFPQECAETAKRWADKAEFGREKGSTTHFFLENLAARRVVRFPRAHSAWVKQAAEYWKAQDFPKVVHMECEVVVADEEKPIAGMIDRVDYLGGWDVKVVDIKSDEDLNDTDQYTRLLPPFDHLYANSINEYSIQVNIYADIIERNTPYKVVDVEIVNVTDKFWEIRKINRFPVLKLI